MNLFLRHGINKNNHSDEFVNSGFKSFQLSTGKNKIEIPFDRTVIYKFTGL